MDHADHVGLIRTGVTGLGGTWADIGAGTGAFTLALADLLGGGSRIVAVDRDPRALDANATTVRSRFPDVALRVVVADIETALDLPPLDGLVAANSLHFVPRDRQVHVIRSLAAHLRPGGAFIVVEYDADGGNPYVPYPISSRTWSRLVTDAGLDGAREIGRVPSRFLGAIYSSVAARPTGD